MPAAHDMRSHQTVHMPYDALERIVWGIKTYGITHTTYDGQENLQLLYNGEYPVLN